MMTFRHRDQIYDGHHEAIIDPELFANVQAILEAANRQDRRLGRNAKSPSLLTSMLFDPDGRLMSPFACQQGITALPLLSDAARAGRDGSGLALARWRDRAAGDRERRRSSAQTASGPEYPSVSKRARRCAGRPTPTRGAVVPASNSRAAARAHGIAGQYRSSGSRHHHRHRCGQDHIGSEDGKARQ